MATNADLSGPPLVAAAAAPVAVVVAGQERGMVRGGGRGRRDCPDEAPFVVMSSIFSKFPLPQALFMILSGLCRHLKPARERREEGEEAGNT